MGSITKIGLAIAIILSLFSCSDVENSGTAGSSEGITSETENVGGTLFIIGGGNRPPAMITRLCELVSDSSDTYILVLTQASGYPDESFSAIAEQLMAFTSLPILHVDSLRIDQMPPDSISKASVIYITGGDQNRFLQVVDSIRRHAIHSAYRNGAVIAGTSAGAALMSDVMITGDQNFVPEYEATYSRLEKGNGKYSKGLGLLNREIVIDQHFVARSRYNRLISAMVDNELRLGIGIEESTALIVQGNRAEVVGEGQVIVFQYPDTVLEKNGKIGFHNLIMSAFLEPEIIDLY